MRAWLDMTKPIVQFDMAISTLFLQHRFNQQIALVSRLVSRSGDGPLYALVGLFAWWHYGDLGGQFLLTGLVAFGLQLPLYWWVKNAVKRRRPAELCEGLMAFITPSDRYSLPSGHTAAAFLMASVVSAYFPSLALFSFVWAHLIGFSRILLGVHFLTDVVLGAGLGLACAQSALHLFSGAL
ncbi:phosphatase PAP2 family protein [Vibrio sp. SM6]|uniref:undecaprenyl-diphosphate phosphatase n=1 Tax=Vibrio agarilyticus TaxID=2726741 RepID=A0A7X8YG68_9VIBR|nr:phosphatase PAP2 family protein [Vibrio agarilyticus]NLS12369.1 phosphatase PAP2 family protein [Vibrio agarilyticus]